MPVIPAKAVKKLGTVARRGQFIRLPSGEEAQLDGQVTPIE